MRPAEPASHLDPTADRAERILLTTTEPAPTQEPNATQGGPIAVATSTPVPEILDETALEQKYGRLDTTELLKAYQSVRNERKAEGDRIARRVWQEGPFDEQFYPEGATPPENKSSPDGKPVTLTYQMEPVSGGTIIRTAKLSDPVRYPEFRALELETDWLHQRLHKLNACTCPAGHLPAPK
jgi:hypothetical protein